MAGTFTQLYIQLVFTVKNRQNLLHPSFRNIIFKYISGIIKTKGHKPIIVNGVSDHIHILVGLKPNMSIADLVRDIKNNSSNFINKQKLTRNHFSWQGGYGAFSYAHSSVNNVYNYILNQEAHHKRKTFEEEYLDILKDFDVDFNERYLFDDVD